MRPSKLCCGVRTARSSRICLHVYIVCTACSCEQHVRSNVNVHCACNAAAIRNDCSAPESNCPLHTCQLVHCRYTHCTYIMPLASLQFSLHCQQVCPETFNCSPSQEKEMSPSLLSACMLLLSSFVACFSDLCVQHGKTSVVVTVICVRSAAQQLHLTHIFVVLCLQPFS